MPLVECASCGAKLDVPLKKMFSPAVACPSCKRPVFQESPAPPIHPPPAPPQLPRKRAVGGIVLIFGGIAAAAVLVAAVAVFVAIRSLSVRGAPESRTIDAPSVTPVVVAKAPDADEKEIPRDDPPVRAQAVVPAPIDEEAAARAMVQEIRSTVIPRDGSETSLVRIKANPLNPREGASELTICGGIAVDDYYNYGYAGQERMFYSIRFREAGDTLGDSLGTTAYLYLRKPRGSPIVDRLVKEEESPGGKLGMPLVRAAVHLDKARYWSGKQWDMLELDDVQSFDFESGKWEPWIIEGEAAKAEQQAKIQKAAREEQEVIDEKAAAERKKIDDAAANKKAVADTMERNERSAKAKLKLANDFLKEGKGSLYRKTLRDLIEKYPYTDAADEARKLLK